MSKRKLFLISPMLHQGGFERVCITTARLLEDQFDVTVVIFSDKNIAYDVSGINIVNLNVPTKKGIASKVLNVLKRTQKLKKLKKEIKPYISYSFGPTANMVNCLSRVKGIKHWTGLRNYTDLQSRGKIKLFTKKSDLIVCCSNEIEKVLKNDFKFDKTATLYNLYDLEAINASSVGELEDWPFDDNNKVIISMGRCDDQKCFWHMIKAFSLVHNKLNNTRLAILGAGDFSMYRELANKLNIEEYVYFAGMRKDPYKFLKRSDVYLLTSYNEGFPNALVEGMSLGLPAIATDCLTGPSEILGDNEYGIVVPLMSKERNLDPTDLSEEKEVADKLIELISDSDKLEYYSKKAIERASCFTYDEYKKKFMELANK